MIVCMSSVAAWHIYSTTRATGRNNEKSNFDWRGLSSKKKKQGGKQKSA